MRKVLRTFGGWGAQATTRLRVPSTSVFREGYRLAPGTNMLADFDGKQPQLDPSAWVHEGAWVIGDVQLEAHANVWPTAVVRGDMGSIRIGAWSNIQDGAVVHMTSGISNTVVGSRVTVGHRAILHGCTVEDDCLIGMGSILLDNCVIGRGSVVGAGALVTQNKVIPPGSMVLGSPAKVVRQITDSEREWIDFSYKIYAEKATLWLRG